MSSLNNPFLIKSYSDEDGNFYRIYSDGWCEQGGIYGASSPGSSVVINFLVPFLTTKYVGLKTNSSGSASGISWVHTSIYAKTMSSMTADAGGTASNWSACGKANLEVI